MRRINTDHFWLKHGGEPSYRGNVVAYSFLNISEGNHLAVDMKAADKFGDAVIRTKDGYFYARSVMETPSSFVITRDDLCLIKSTFSLVNWFKSFTQSLRNPMFFNQSYEDFNTSLRIKELTATTNAGVSDDVREHFLAKVDRSDTWDSMGPKGERYKIDYVQLNQADPRLGKRLRKAAMAVRKAVVVGRPSVDLIIAAFFDLFVLEVNEAQPEEMDDIIKRKVLHTLTLLGVN